MKKLYYPAKFKKPTLNYSNIKCEEDEFITLVELDIQRHEEIVNEKFKL